MLCAQYTSVIHDIPVIANYFFSKTHHFYFIMPIVSFWLIRRPLSNTKRLTSLAQVQFWHTSLLAGQLHKCTRHQYIGGRCRRSQGRQEGVQQHLKLEDERYQVHDRTQSWGCWWTRRNCMCKGHSNRLATPYYQHCKYFSLPQQQPTHLAAMEQMPISHSQSLLSTSIGSK